MLFTGYFFVVSIISESWVAKDISGSDRLDLLKLFAIVILHTTYAYDYEFNCS